MIEKLCRLENDHIFTTLTMPERVKATAAAGIKYVLLHPKEIPKMLYAYGIKAP